MELHRFLTNDTDRPPAMLTLHKCSIAGWLVGNSLVIVIVAL